MSDLAFPKWTHDRPSSMGRYRVSIHPDKRPLGYPKQVVVEVGLVPRWHIEDGYPDVTEKVVVVCAIWLHGDPRRFLSDSFFDGALWRSYVEPGDPFVNDTASDVP